MNVLAGVILTAIMCVYSTILYAIVLHERAADREHFADVIKDIRAEIDRTNRAVADLATLPDVVIVDQADEPEGETETVEIPEPEDPPTAPITEAIDTGWETVQPTWVDDQLRRFTYCEQGRAEEKRAAA